MYSSLQTSSSYTKLAKCEPSSSLINSALGIAVAANSAFANGANGAMEDSNFNQGHRDAGLRTHRVVPVKPDAAISFAPADFRRFAPLLEQQAPRVMATVATPPDSDGWCSLSLHAGASVAELARAGGSDAAPIVSVPSGNFGNLTAGLIAKRIGLPVRRFVAATNVNDAVPEYLLTGRYEPRPSVRTVANAMDVGAPSNFERILETIAARIYDNQYAFLRENVQNAIDATRDGGKVGVRVCASGANAVVEVADTGCGMSEQFVRQRLLSWRILAEDVLALLYRVEERGRPAPTPALPRSRHATPPRAGGAEPLAAIGEWYAKCVEMGPTTLIPSMIQKPLERTPSVISRLATRATGRSEAILPRPLWTSSISSHS